VAISSRKSTSMFKDLPTDVLWTCFSYVNPKFYWSRRDVNPLLCICKSWKLYIEIYDETIRMKKWEFLMAGYVCRICPNDWSAEKWENWKTKRVEPSIIYCQHEIDAAKERIKQLRSNPVLC